MRVTLSVYLPRSISRPVVWPVVSPSPQASSDDGRRSGEHQPRTAYSRLLYIRYHSSRSVDGAAPERRTFYGDQKMSEREIEQHKAVGGTRKSLIGGSRLATTTNMERRLGLYLTFSSSLRLFASRTPRYARTLPTFTPCSRRVFPYC